MTQDEIIEMWNSVIKYAPSEVRIAEFAKLVAAKAFQNGHEKALAQPEQEAVGYWKEHAQGMERDYDLLLADYEKLAQPEQEPVAWQWLDTAHFRKKLPKDAGDGVWNPLYAAPQRTFVGLTDVEIEQAIELISMLHGDYATEVAYVIEAKLKERNT